MKSIELRGDGAERIIYSFPEISVYIAKGRLSLFRNMEAACHWHNDWEIVCVTEGSMAYFVNNERVVLKEGQAIFVNSRCMHYNYSVAGKDASYLCLLLHPKGFDSQEKIRQRYIEPLIQNRSMAYHVFSGGDALALLDIVNEILNYANGTEQEAELAVLSSGYRIIDRMYKAMKSLPTHIMVGEPRLNALYNMISFVQSHYPDQVSLSEIAAAGNVSKSSCCSIFREYLQQTPVGYMTSYRLERSEELLRNTNMTVTEVAMQVGFSSQSYFTETFRKYCGITPTEYRRKQMKSMN